MKANMKKQFGKWFEELKDIVTNDLLRQHINKYPEKKDFEIEAQSADGHKEQDENKDCGSSEE
jgi:hypothetical protein